MINPSFKPFISDEQILPEFTLRAVVLGALLGIVFGASSVYLALKAGQTVSASIPCAVIATLLFRSKTRSPILECNMVQTIGSAGESIAAGVVFTVPALIFLGFDMEILHTLLLALTGGLLGVLMMIPLRRYLIVKEHGVLTYPEGTACAEILTASERGGAQAKRVFSGIILGSIYKLLMSGLRFWQDTPTWLPRWYPGGTLSAEVSPELMGVGYIIGFRTSALMVAGGVLSWLILIPIFRFLGSGLNAPLFPAADRIRDMSNEQIYYAYVRYIGAGAVATGGLINLFRSMPSIVASFKASARQLLGSSADPAGVRRTERDMPISVVVGGSAALIVLIWLLPIFQVNLLSAVLIVIFGFFFSVVSSRLTGQVGSSSCPNSGMAIATLIGTCLIFLMIGWSGHAYSAVALSVGAIVCIASSNAGTTSQDLKTGFLLGATPIRQQTGLLIGVATSVLVIGWTIYLLNARLTTIEAKNFGDYTVSAAAWQGKPTMAGPDQHAYVRLAFVGDARVPDGHYLVSPEDGKIHYQEVQGIESTKLQAPQAKLMSVVIRGILDRKLPWGLILMGVFIAVMVELVGVQALPFGVGCYLSLSTTGAIFLGGLVRRAADAFYRREPDDPNEAEGTLYSSGLIAGGALVGIVTAAFAGAGANEKLALGPKYLGPLADSGALSLGMFVLLGWSLFRSAKR